MSNRVLIVDDSVSIRAFIKNALEQGGYEVVGQATNGEEAIELAFSLEPDYITLDNVLPDRLGTDVLKVWTEEGLSSKVIMISAVDQNKIIDQGIKLGAAAYLIKPFTAEKLLQTIANIQKA